MKKKKVVTFVHPMETLSLFCIQERSLLQFLEYLTTMVLVIILMLSWKNKVRENIRLLNKHFYLQTIYKTAFNKGKIHISSLFPPYVFLKVHILETSCKFKRQNSCRIVTAITLHCSVIEIALLYGWPPVNIVQACIIPFDIFETSDSKSWGLFFNIRYTRFRSHWVVSIGHSCF